MRAYLRLTLGAAVAMFVAVWAWIVLVPMAWMDPEYGAWQAKLTLLDRCELGEIVILGDSRAAAGILPLRLDAPALNLALGGGEPIEALSLLRRALACPVRPRRVILSFDPGHFMEPDLFWERSVRFGLVGTDELDELARMSRATGDWSVHEARQDDGMPPAARAWLHRLRFPTLHFASVLRAGGALRWRRNHARYEQTLASRGHYSFGTDAGSDVAAREARLRRFAPSSVLAAYFDQVLFLLSASGIPALFVPMPVNAATAQAADPALAQGFEAFLTGFQARYPTFRLLAPVMTAWPNDWFGDGFAHLNPAGAAAFSDWLARCMDCRTPPPPPSQRLQAAPPSTQNDAQNG